MGEYIPVISKDHPEISAEIWIDDVDGMLCAQAYLVGHGFGDLLIQLVQEELTKYASKKGRPVLHEMIPSNPQALKLAMRSKGYSFTSKTDGGLPIFTKTFYP